MWRELRLKKPTLVFCHLTLQKWCEGGMTGPKEYLIVNVKKFKGKRYNF